MGIPAKTPMGSDTLVLSAVLSLALVACGHTNDTETAAESETSVDSASVGDTDTDGDTDCGAGFRVKASVSPMISTVGIVEWRHSTGSIASAYIEFGLDTGYGYVAPVDLRNADFRTLLLGMKPSRTYHYRITARTDSSLCSSPDYTLDTGAPPTGIVLTIDTLDETALSGGFMISSFLSRSTAFILDRDGDLVWWYEFTNPNGWDGLSRAKMSADGNFMWAATPNVFGDEGNGYLYRIAMDGVGEQETLHINRHHDFTVLPDNSIVYIEFTDRNGDRIVERSASGETRTIYTLGEDFPADFFDSTHCNAIHYIPEEDAFTISCLHLTNIIKVSRTGTLLWDFEGDGDAGDFAGPSWQGQHGHHLLDNGNLLLFNNGDPGFGDPSAAVREFSLSQSTSQADEIWRYDGDEGSINYGDVIRIPNGNTLVDYSLSGIIHEVTPEKRLVRKIVTNEIGYLDWRETLYGPPTRW